MTSKQAASYLGIKENTLRKWRMNAKTYPLSSPTPIIPCVKMGRKIVYDKEILDGFIKNNTIGVK